VTCLTRSKDAVGRSGPRLRGSPSWAACWEPRLGGRPTRAGHAAKCERTFVAVRRHTKIIRPLRRRDIGVSLIWAVLEFVSDGWRGITMTPRAVGEIERVRRGRTHIPVQRPTEEVIAA
jgi:hypothetical protein